MARQWVSLVMALSICGLTSSTVWAQKNNRNKQAEKRENERVAAAQKDVRKQQEDLNEVQQKLRGLMRNTGGLEANQVKARNHLVETREKVADQMAKSLGIEAALERLKVAKAELAAFSQPLIEQLHQSTAWIAAKKAAEQAKTEIEKLRENADLTEEDQKQKLDQLTKVLLHPNELDKQAVANKPEGKRLNDKVTDALSAIEKIRRAVPDEKVEADSEVVQAKKALEKAEQEIRKHAQSVSSERSQLAKAQQQLQQARLKLQQAQAADRK